MKQSRLYLFLLLSAGSLAFFSCKKCMKCTYVEPSTMIIDREDCGNKDQLELFKADVIKEADGFGVSEAKVSCVDSK